jgi:hypothetical protein
MNCPVCRATVKDITPIGYRGLVVKCPKCGSYRIAESALAALLVLKTAERLEALLRARRFASYRAWPTIDRASL